MMIRRPWQWLPILPKHTPLSVLPSCAVSLMPDIFLLTVNVIQWGALWFGARMGNDVVYSLCTP